MEVWSDVVCPWCYIGKRRFETALATFEHGDEVEVVWRSFELDPRAPRLRDGSLAERLARKYGMSIEQALAANRRLTDLAAAEELTFRFDTARPGNTFDAHRVLHLARDRGIQDAVKERFLSAYFTEGRAIGDRTELVALAGEAGLDEAEAHDVLETDRYGADVRADEEAAVELGVSGVPFFLLGGKVAVPGAQPSDVMLSALRRAWDKTQPENLAPGPACDEDGCPV